MKSAQARMGQPHMTWPSEESTDDAEKFDEEDDDLDLLPVHFTPHHQVFTKDQQSHSCGEEEEMGDDDDVPVSESRGPVSFSTLISTVKLKEMACLPHTTTGITVPTSTPILSSPASSVKAMTTASQAEQLHECPHCVATFVDANNLRRHLSYIHADKLDEKDSKGSKGNKRCEVCGKIFNLPSRLERHKVIHTGERPFVCNVCNKAFSRASNLKTHKVLHTGRKSFVCDVCNKAFCDASYLKKHQVIHTGDKPFVCDICGKAFVETGHLKRHKKYHIGHKPYACDVCGKAFVDAGSLKRHKVQTNHNPIICYVCNRTFLLPEHLEEHHKVHVQQRDIAGEEKTGIKL